MSAPSLFSPARIGPLTLCNRFIKSATNEGMARSGLPSKMLVKHPRDIVAGGAAIQQIPQRRRRGVRLYFLQPLHPPNDAVLNGMPAAS